MSKIRLFAILAFTLSAFLIYPTTHAQIMSIGSGPFTKCFIERITKGAILKATLQLYEGDEVLYFDNENNIRKYVSDFNYPESRFLVVASYDILGKLSSIIFSISVPGGISCYGASTISYDKPNNPIFDYEIYWSKNHRTRENSTGVFDSLPKEIEEEFDINRYISISDLLKTIDLKDISIPNKCKKVIFRRPLKYDYAMLNTYKTGYNVSIFNVEVNNNGKKRYEVEFNGKHKFFSNSELEDIEVVIEN